MTPMGPTDPQDRQPWWHADARLDVLEAEVARLTADWDEWRRQLDESDKSIASWIERFDRSQAALAKAIDDAGHIFDEKQAAESALALLKKTP